VTSQKDFKDDVELYYLLKMLDKAPYESREEYRKNVALIVEEIEVDIVKLKEFFEKTQDFVKRIEDL